MTEETKAPWKIEKARVAALNSMPAEAFDKMMCEKFPSIFVNRRKPMNESCMHWGFGIEQGWQAILHDLCVQLTLMHRYSGIWVVADQVKEKFGGLRFYTHWEKDRDISREEETVLSEILDAIVDSAELKAAHTCEICGECGEIVTICCWSAALCEKHAEERRKEKELEP